MKKRLVFAAILTLILVLLLGFYPKASAISEELPLLGKIIFVDPGHGGYGKIQK